MSSPSTVPVTVVPAPVVFLEYLCTVVFLYLCECNFFAGLKFAFKHKLTLKFKLEIKFFLIHFDKALDYNICPALLQYTGDTDLVISLGENSSFS